MPNFIPILSEIFLVISTLFMLIISSCSKKSKNIINYFTYLVFTIALYILIFKSKFGQTLNNFFILDSFTSSIKILILVISFIIFLILSKLDLIKNIDYNEYLILLILSTLSSMLIVSANDMMSLYLSLELNSLCLYVMSSINKHCIKSSESGLKYFILGTLSSGILLYGISLIYLSTGSININFIHKILLNHHFNNILLIGLIFILVGIAFKASLVPFHMWIPDVYEGSPTLSTTVFATISKTTIITVMIRLITISFQPISFYWKPIFIGLSILSMILGSITAISQNNIKRLMAYSSITHAGYMLIGLSSANIFGIKSVIFYIFSYIPITLGVFICILLIQKNTNIININNLSGLSKNNLLLSISLSIFLWSLAGIPPFIGFFSKLFVFASAINNKMYYLVIIAIIVSVISAFYYLKIIKTIFFSKNLNNYIIYIPIELKFILIIFNIYTLTFLFIPKYFINFIDKMVSNLFV